MKYFFCFFMIWIIFCGCSEDCIGDGTDEIIIVSTMVLEDISSNEMFQSSLKANSYRANIEENSLDLVQIRVVAKEDTLSYAIKHKKWSNTYVIIDSIPITSCKSVHWLAEKGYEHYRVDSKQLYSCVFYFEPSCE